MKKLLALSLAAASLSTTASAVVLFSDSFDGLADGLIGGQGTWDLVSDPVFLVQSAVNNGGKSVLADLGGSTAGSYWSWPVLTPEYNSATTGNKIVIGSVDVRYGNGSDMRFGLDAYRTTPFFARVHAMRVNTTTNRVSLLNTAGTAWLDSSVPTTPNAWARMSLVLDYGHSRAWGVYDGLLLDISEAFPTTLLTCSDIDLYAVKLSGGTGLGYFDNYSVETEAGAFIAYQINSGEAFEGNVASISSSDDSRLAIFNDPTSLVGTITFSGITSVLNPSSVTVGLEASAARSGLQQSLALFNFSTNEFQILNGIVATDEDSTVEVTANSNFVDSRGLVQARVSWSPINDEDPSQDGWPLQVDAITLSAN